MFYALWDPQTGELIFASGGHTPSLYVTRDNTVEELRAKGIALGVIGDATFEERRIFLKPGEVLVSYTDGVTEAMQVDYTEWGMERFREVVKQSRQQSAEDIVARILWQVDSFVAGAPQSDDLTLWALKRLE
jgi:sigma-B regulation protein RsbU (phosphoserine phosphatase)